MSSIRCLKIELLLWHGHRATGCTSHLPSWILQPLFCIKNTKSCYFFCGLSSTWFSFVHFREKLKRLGSYFYHLHQSHLSWRLHSVSLNVSSNFFEESKPIRHFWQQECYDALCIWEDHLFSWHWHSFMSRWFHLFLDIGVLCLAQWTGCPSCAQQWHVITKAFLHVGECVMLNVTLLFSQLHAMIS
jgi:hypothetical protein